MSDIYKDYYELQKLCTSLQERIVELEEALEADMIFQKNQAERIKYLEEKYEA
jgi:hypothetical protein